jgi:P27 family predicted phage terminase small subunit
MGEDAAKLPPELLGESEDIELPEWLPSTPDNPKAAARQVRFTERYELVVEYVKRLGGPTAKVDAALVEQYVTAWCMHSDAAETLVKIGPLVRQPDGTATVNPMLAIAKGAQAACSTSARDLGVGPLNRVILGSRLYPKYTTPNTATISPQARTARQRTLIKPLLPVFR